MKLERNKKGIRTWEMLLSGAISLVLSFTIYLLFIQSPLVSKRELLAVILIFVVLIWVVFLCLNRYLIPHLEGSPPRKKAVLLIISGLAGFLVLFTTNQPPLYLITPAHSFHINVPEASDATTQERVVAITWITHDLGDVSFSQLKSTGEWTIAENGISHTGPDPAALEWKGKTGQNISIEFQYTPYANPITINWDGQEASFDLSGDPGKTFAVSQSFSAREGHHFLISVLLWFATSFLFFLVTIFFLTYQIEIKPSAKKRRCSWLVYTLPMIIVWGIYLLTFFPGMMSPDSNDQWSQILTGHFNDTHPVFHTLSMWLVTRIWLSPASVVIAQILFLSLTVAWGIHLLEEHGLPHWASWLLAAIFALAPLNANMVIVLWKDIPYSTSLLLFSLMILMIVLTHGAWLDKRLTWVWLGLVSLCIASFRHNGLPIPVVTILVLLVVYRKWWKPLLKAIALSTILFAIIHGPFYKALGVGQRQLGFIQDVMLHHISAHINTGKPLTPTEQALADSILPREQWKYDSCTVLSIIHSTNYPDLFTSIQGKTIQKLFVGLAIKEPLVELQHLVNVSSIVWRSPGFCGANTLLPYDSRIWIDPGYKRNTEKSLIPPLIKPLTNLFINLKTNPVFSVFISPAVYLWLGIYATAILSIRRRNWKIILFVLPIVIQSSVYLLINVSDQFRYHYGAYLIGLFGIGLLLIAINLKSERVNLK